MDKNPTFKALSLLILLVCCWAPSYLFIKIAVGEIPPLTLMTLRIGTGAVILYIICYLQGRKLTQRKNIWLHFTVMGITLNALPFVLIAYGEQYISSSLAAILNGTTPMFTVLFAHFFISYEKMSFRKILGVLIGILGIIILYLPALEEGVYGTELGIILLTLSSVSYGLGAVYARKHLHNLPPLVAPCAQLIMGALVLVPFSLLVDHPFSLPLPSFNAIFAVSYLSIIGTAVAFFLYYEVVRLSSATFVSLTALLVPLAATILGATFLHELLGWYSYLGGALILGSLVFLNTFFQKKKN